jgi:DNA mismatch repair protein MSH5
MPLFQRGRIGCAYYNPVNFLIYVLEDTQETAHFDVTKTRQSYKKDFRVF